MDRVETATNPGDSFVGMESRVGGPRPTARDFSDAIGSTLRSRGGWSIASILRRQKTYRVGPLSQPTGESVRSVNYVADSSGILRGADGAAFKLTGVALGKGSLGQVSLCFDRSTKELLAAKKISGIGSQSTQEAEQEANAYHLGQSVWAPRTTFIPPRGHAVQDAYNIMPLGCGDMFTLLDEAEKPVNKAARLGLALITAREVGRNLLTLHHQKFAHRDIKPLNIFYRDTVVALGDYDMARPFNHNNYLATLDYAPPETLHLASRVGQHKLDMWSLALSVLDVGNSHRDKVSASQMGISLGTFNRALALHTQAKSGAVDMASVRSGEFTLCYKVCGEARSYSRTLYARAAIALRAFALVHPQVFAAEQQLPILPRPIQSDDPLNHVPEEHIKALQQVFIDGIRALPGAFGEVVHACLSPEPNDRPDIEDFVSRLADETLGERCHVKAGEDLLRKESARRGKELAQRLASSSRAA